MPTPTDPPVSDPAAPDLPAPAPKDPLHGLTLATMLEDLVNFYGWEGLAERIALRCFADQPSLTSSLKMLRKTPWARAKVESLYLYTLREERRQQRQASDSGQAG